MTGFVAVAFWLLLFFVCWAFQGEPERRYAPIAKYAERSDGKSAIDRDAPMLSKDACLKRSQQKYLSTENTFLWGRIEKHNDGVSAPQWRGCEVIDHTGKATGEVLK